MKSRTITNILDRLRWASEELGESVTALSPEKDLQEVQEILHELQQTANRIMAFCMREEVSL
jgi:uncharacterized damage-inducible protein DinB